MRDLEKSSNVIAGLALGLFLITATVFVVASFEAKAGEVAQAFGNILGSALGTLGAFAVAYWTLSKQDSDKRTERDRARQLIEIDVERLSSAVFMPIMMLIRRTSDNGLLPTEFFRGIPKPESLKRHRDGRFNYSLFDALAMANLEYLEDVVDEYRKTLDLVSQDATNTEENQRRLWSQLDHLRIQAGALATTFSETGRSTFQEQMDSFLIYDYVPNVGQPFSGRAIEGLLAQWNEIARRANASREPS